MEEEREYRRGGDAFKGSECDGRSWVMGHHLYDDAALTRGHVWHSWSPNAPLLSRWWPEQPNSPTRALYCIFDKIAFKWCCHSSPSRWIFFVIAPLRSNDFFNVFTSLFTKIILFSLFFSFFAVPDIWTCTRLWRWQAMVNWAILLRTMGMDSNHDGRPVF